MLLGSADASAASALMAALLQRPLRPGFLPTDAYALMHMEALGVLTARTRVVGRDIMAAVQLRARVRGAPIAFPVHDCDVREVSDG